MLPEIAEGIVLGARKQTAIWEIWRRQALERGAFLVLIHPRQARTRHGRRSRNPAIQKIAFRPSRILMVSSSFVTYLIQVESASSCPRGTQITNCDVVCISGVEPKRSKLRLTRKLKISRRQPLPMPFRALACWRMLRYRSRGRFHCHLQERWRPASQHWRN